MTSIDAPIELKKGAMEYSFLEVSEQDNYYLSFTSLSNEITVQFRLEKVAGSPTLLLHECPSLTDVSLCKLADASSALAKSTHEWLAHDLKPHCTRLPTKDYRCQLGVAVQGPGQYYLRYDVEGVKVVLSSHELHKSKLQEGASADYVFNAVQPHSSVKVSLNRLFGSCSLVHAGKYYGKSFAQEDTQDPVEFKVLAST